MEAENVFMKSCFNSLLIHCLSFDCKGQALLSNFRYAVEIIRNDLCLPEDQCCIILYFLKTSHIGNG